VLWGGTALLCAAVALPAFAADPVDTVATEGSGKLTLCRSWFFFSSCQSYNHIDVPKRLKLGDNIDLVFGSNTKKISFLVARIAQDGDRCTVYNDPGTATDDVNRIEMESCSRAPP